MKGHAATPKTILARIQALRDLRIDPQDAQRDGLLLPSRAAQALHVGEDLLGLVVEPAGKFHGSIRLYDPRDLIIRRYDIWARDDARERRRRRRRELKIEASRSSNATSKRAKLHRLTAWEHILKSDSRR